MLTASPSELPSGTVTFLFTDTEGSTRAWDEDPEAARRELARQEEVLREAVHRHGGAVFKTTGDGLLAAFSDPADALRAALQAQLALREGSLRVRMALHSGMAQAEDGDYHAPALNRCARLLGSAWGGQVVLSLATQELVRDQLPDRITLGDLGTVELRDLAAPERVFQLLHPELPPQFPPLRSAGTRPHNLPAQLTSFVGRERELAEVTKLLGQTRLLTLVGVGGAGKTRLALEAAARVLEDHRDGVRWVELAPLGAGDLVPVEVASVLGVKEQPGRSLSEVLAGALGERELLLVLDNCEHLIEAVTSLVDRLLRATSAVRVLATSREGLGIGGEILWQVPSLELSSEAVQLFTERARALRPDLDFESHEGVVAQICRRLDGLPLAIELAAARVRSLSVEAIATRLDDRFRLLTGGSRTALPRQQTLEAAVGWSYELLEGPERRLFERLSVFSGGFTLEAAERVCSIEPIPEHEVIDLLSSLVEKSLVATREDRYRMLETIRQYARDRLVAYGESDEVRRQHARFYLDLAESEVGRFRGAQPEREAALDRLSADYDNLRSALEWAAESGATETFQRLLVALAWSWQLMDSTTEAREWLEKGLAEEWSDPLQRASVLLGLVASIRMDDYQRANRLAEEALEVFEEAGESLRVADALLSLADAAWYQDDLARSEEYALRAVELYRQLGYRRGVAVALIDLARALRDRGDLEGAVSCFREAEGCRDDISLRTLLNVRMHLAVTLWYMGRHEEALRILTESLETAREHGYEWDIAHLSFRMGTVRASYGEHQAAVVHLQESLPPLREVGDAHCAALATTALGLATTRAGSPEGRSMLREGVLANHGLGAKGAIAGSLLAAAAACTESGQHATAGRLLGAAEGLRTELEAPLSPPEEREHEFLVGTLRTELGPEEFEAAWREGAALDADQAVAFAVEALS